MILVDVALLDEVTREARLSPRLRKNRNFHPQDDSRCHRLLNAVEPGSYIPPHRHLDPEKGEAMIILRGRLGVVYFGEEGSVTETAVLEAGGTAAVDIPAGQYHTVFALEAGTVFYEAKAGPYRPLAAEERASWAPGEGAADATVFLRRMVELVTP